MSNQAEDYQTKQPSFAEPSKPEENTADHDNGASEGVFVVIPITRFNSPERTLKQSLIRQEASAVAWIEKVEGLLNVHLDPSEVWYDCGPDGNLREFIEGNLTIYMDVAQAAKAIRHLPDETKVFADADNQHEVTQQLKAMSNPAQIKPKQDGPDLIR